MVWWLKNRFKIEMLIFFVNRYGFVNRCGLPTPGKGVGECLVTISPMGPDLALPWDHMGVPWDQMVGVGKVYRGQK